MTTLAELTTSISSINRISKYKRDHETRSNIGYHILYDIISFLRNKRDDGTSSEKELGIEKYAMEQVKWCNISPKGIEGFGNYILSQPDLLIEVENTIEKLS